METTLVQARPTMSARAECPPRLSDRGTFYRPELDMLRFFAFLAVFIHHGIYNANPLLSTCGGFGLCLFFVLSSYLITELLQREKTLTGSIAIRDFYVRRVLRIWPLYFAAILGAVLAHYFWPGHEISRGLIVSYLLMAGNFYIGRYGFPPTFVGYLWSISVEEQFYLAWPLLNRASKLRHLIPILLLLLPIGAGTVLGLAASGVAPAGGIWTNTLVQFQMFAFGALISLALKGSVANISFLGRLSLVAAGVAAWWSAARFSGIDDHSIRGGFGLMWGYWAVGLGCVCILISVLGLPGRLVPRWLVYLGKISYGLYVFHQLGLELASTALNYFRAFNSVAHHARYGVAHVTIGLGLTALLSAFSYRYFERPFLKLKDRFTVVRSRIA